MSFLKKMLTKISGWQCPACDPNTRRQALLPRAAQWPLPYGTTCARRNRFTVHIGEIPGHCFTDVELPSILDGKWGDKELRVTAIWLNHQDASVETNALHWATGPAGRKPKNCHIRIYNGEGMVIGVFDMGKAQPTNVTFSTLSDTNQSEPIVAFITLKCSKCVVEFFPEPVSPDDLTY